MIEQTPAAEILRLGRTGRYRDEEGCSQFLATLQSEQVRAEKLVRHSGACHVLLVAFMEAISESSDCGQWRWRSVDGDLALWARRTPGSPLQLEIQLAGTDPGAQWRTAAEVELDREGVSRLTHSLSLLDQVVV